MEHKLKSSSSLFIRFIGLRISIHRCNGHCKQSANHMSGMNTRNHIKEGSARIPIQENSNVIQGDPAFILEHNKNHTQDKAERQCYPVNCWLIVSECPIA